MYLRNTAGQSFGFCLVDSSGNAVTGASVTAKRSIDTGGQANATGSVSELGNGQYCFCMSQADTNGTNISFLFTATGAVPVEKSVVTEIAASGGSFFGIRPPRKLAGKRYSGPHAIGTTDSAVVSANTLYYLAYYNDQVQTYAGLEFRDIGGTNNGKNVRVGVYDEALTGGPGSLVCDVGAVTLTGTPNAHAVSSAFSLNANSWYYFALVSDSTPTLSTCGLYKNISNAGWAPQYMMPNTLLGTFVGIAGIDAFNSTLGDKASFTYGSLPATAPTPTSSTWGNSAMPHIVTFV